MKTSTQVPRLIKNIGHADRQPFKQRLKGMLGLASKVSGYIPALTALAAAIVLHQAILLVIGAQSAAIFFIYLVAILIAGWCGYGPGILVVLLSVYVVPYLYKPNFSFRSVPLDGIGVLLLVSIIISRVSTTRRRTEAQLRDTNTELDRRVRRQTEELEQAKTALEHQVAELETLYGKLPVGLCFLDKELRYVRINEKLAAINGIPVADHSGRGLGDVLPAPLFALLDPLFRRVLETGEPLLDHELHGPSPTDVADERDWLLGCTPVVTDDGVVLGLQINVQDISERKRAEQALRRANEDLAQFAYIAAHDLQEPLRTAVIFSQLVQRRSRDKLDSESEEYLGHIVEAGKRMCQLISDVLAYSRASDESDVVSKPVNLEEVLTSVLESLKTHIDEAEARIVHDRLPTVDGDAGRLGQVFLNLLGNSLKYRKSEVPPRIEVKATQQNGSWLFAVRDNGKGFSQEYAERIFGIFKRLEREQPGSGIGLAICKTVIERHGGKIWAEGGEGQGATFYFTLPTHRRGGQLGGSYGR